MSRETEAQIAGTAAARPCLTHFRGMRSIFFARPDARRNRESRAIDYCRRDCNDPEPRLQRFTSRGRPEWDLLQFIANTRGIACRRSRRRCMKRMGFALGAA